MSYVTVFLLFVSLPSFSKDIFLSKEESKIYSVSQDTVIHIDDQDYDRLIVVENQDLDTYGSIHVNDKEINSASWMGPYGNYLILIPGNSTDLKVKVKPLESSVISTTVKLTLLSLQGKSANFMKGIENYTLANDLRIKKYLGHPNKTQQAIGHFSAAEQYFEYDQADFYLGLTLYEKGIALKGMGAQSQAIDALSQSIEYWSENHPIQSLRVLNPMGLTYWNMGKLQQALDKFNQIINTYTDDLNSLVLAQAVNNAGLIHWELGEFTEAKNRFYQSLEINGVSLNAEHATTDDMITAINKGDDRKNTAATLNNLALIYDGLGEPETAESIWLAYIELSKNVSNRTTLAKAKNNLAMHYLRKGDYDQAQELLESARAVFEQNSNNRWLFLTQHNLGVLYDELGMLELAEIHFKKALNNRDPKNNAKGHMESLYRLASIYTKQEKIIDGLRLSQELLALAEAHNNVKFVALSHLNQYAIYHQQDNLTQAGHQINMAVQSIANSPYKRLSSRINTTRAEFLMASKKHTEAVEILNNEVKILEKIWNTRLLNKANNLLARAYYLDRNYQAAQQVIGRELKNINFYLNNTANAKIAGNLQGLLKETLNINALIQQELGKPEQGFLQTVQQIKQFQNYQKDSATTLNTNRTGINGWLQSIQDKSMALENRSLSKAEKERLEDEIIELKAKIDLSYQRTSLAKSDHLSLKDIQEQLDEETLLLVYSIGESDGLSWWISRNQFISHKLSDKQTLKDLIALSRHEITGHSRSYQHSKKLSVTLMQPLAKFHHIKKIKLMTDEPLNLVSFSSLQDARNDYSTAIAATSGIQRILNINALSHSGPTLKNDVRALIVADPVNSVDDSRLLEKPKKTDVLTGYPRLKNTVRETELIKEKLTATAITGFAANKDHFLAMDLSQYSILHLATHAFFHPEIPGLSSLVLSAYTDKGRLRKSAYLRALDIGQLNSDFDLTVLSACETGLGDSDDALGLSGLTESFLMAGSDYVVASLWQVDDQASSQFMVYFYGNLVNDVTIDEALWQAQKAMLKNPRTHHPKYWAGWFLITK